jgi:FAD/FMN-containing dehydrogenase
MSSKLFVNHIAEAEDITGAENVKIITSNDTLCRNISKALDTMCIPPRANLFLSAVIAPRTIEDIQELLRLFHRVKIPVWPFYSTDEEDLRHVIPRVPGSVGLDLVKYMNNIAEVNKDQLYAIVEPGVSWAALARDISQRGLDDQFWIDWPISSRELIVDHVIGPAYAARYCSMEINLR